MAIGYPWSTRSESPGPGQRCSMFAQALVIPALLTTIPQIQGGSHGIRGQLPGDRFGSSLTAAGDLDGDGVCDLAVGAPRAGVEFAHAGQVRVFSGRTGAEIWRVEGDSRSDGLGTALASAGDVDQDGVPDLIMGAPGGTPPSGSAHVRSGRDGSILWQFEGSAAGDQFGSSVAGAGDMNGDGVPDLAVGAPRSDRGGVNSGEVCTFSGADGSLLFRAVGMPWDQLGRSVAAAGDLNADGCSDIAVGVPFSDVAAFNGGSVYVLSGQDGARLLDFHGQGIGDQLGFALAGGVDVNLDGTADLLCAAPGADAPGRLDAGAAQLHSGRHGDLLLSVHGERSAEYLSAVSFCSDVNEDGRPDLLIGAASSDAGASESGQARLLCGSSGETLLGVAGLEGGDWFGVAVAGLPDLDRDGVPEFAVGAPGHDDEIGSWGYVRVLSGQVASQGVGAGH